MKTIFYLLLLLVLTGCGSDSNDEKDYFKSARHAYTCKGAEGTQFVDIDYPYMTVYRGTIKFKMQSTFYSNAVKNKSWTYWKDSSILKNKIFEDVYKCTKK